MGGKYSVGKEFLTFILIKKKKLKPHSTNNLKKLYSGMLYEWTLRDVVLQFSAGTPARIPHNSELGSTHTFTRKSSTTQHSLPLPDQSTGREYNWRKFVSAIGFILFHQLLCILARIRRRIQLSSTQLELR